MNKQPLNSVSINIVRMNRNICFYILSFIFLFSALSLSQTKGKFILTGKVTDFDTGSSLEGASVYFAQTTIGTWVNKSGNFVLKVAKPGNYELIVSMVGYETQKQNLFLGKDSIKNIHFKLVPKVVNIKALVITADNQDEWKKNMAIFKRIFLGSIASASEYYLENIEFINFSSEKGILKASTSKPIVVISNYLGYRIEVELVLFDYNLSNEVYHFSYYPRFIELTPENNNQMDEWRKNRDNYYLGSPAHFIWALKNNRVGQELFSAVKGHDVIDNWSSVKKQLYGTGEFYYSFEGTYKIIYKRGDVSYIEMKTPFFTIDENGIADTHLPFSVGGYWAKSGIANLIPRDYQPASLKQ